MLIVTNSWKMWLAGLAVSAGIFLVVYFTVIKPATDTANKAVSTGLQQEQQALQRSQQQLNQAKQQAPTAKAKQELDNAAKLTQCIQAAGTDTTKIQDCQTQFGG